MSKDKAKMNVAAGTTNSKKSLIVVIAVASIIICALVGVIAYLLTQSNNSPAADNTVVIPDNIITPDNVDEVIEKMEEKAENPVPVGYYEVSMNTHWVFPDGASTSTNAYVENSTSNQNTVYFTVALKGSDEEIYRSPYMMVGSHLDEIQLDVALEKGDYDAVITYHLVDEEFKDLSSVSMFMTISIEQ